MLKTIRTAPLKPRVSLDSGAGVREDGWSMRARDGWRIGLTGTPIRMALLLIETSSGLRESG